MTVQLSQLVEALDLQSTFLLFFVDRRTGEIVTLTREEVTEKDPLAEEILSSSNRVPLPEDLDKKAIILEFTAEIEDQELRSSLEDGIEEEEAFSRFNVAAHFFQLDKQWLAFIEERLRGVAKAFCQKHGLSFTEGKSSADWL